MFLIVPVTYGIVTVLLASLVKVGEAMTKQELWSVFSRGELMRMLSDDEIRRFKHDVSIKAPALACVAKLPNVHIQHLARALRVYRFEQRSGTKPHAQARGVYELLVDDIYKYLTLTLHVDPDILPRKEFVLSMLANSGIDS